MQDALRRIQKGGGDRGWYRPGGIVHGNTLEALERRGFVELRFDRLLRWEARLTEDGRRYFGLVL